MKFVFGVMLCFENARCCLAAFFLNFSYTNNSKQISINFQFRNSRLPLPNVRNVPNMSIITTSRGQFEFKYTSKTASHTCRRKEYSLLKIPPKKTPLTNFGRKWVCLI